MKMKIDILTLFPGMFKGPFEESILKRAQEKGLVKIKIHNLRSWAHDKHKTVDDKPYGGGAGMVLRVDVVDKALKEILRQAQDDKVDLISLSTSSNSKIVNRKSKIILLSPQGKVFNQKKARELVKVDHLILVAGHYEGFDERIRENLIDDEISMGDYVLTGGELPAMVIVDTIIRLIPGVLGKEESLIGETHSKPGIKKYPVYTRPEEYKGWKVPEILLSGNHAEIEKWRKEKTPKK